VRALAGVLGPYEIVSPLDAGEIGEIYREGHHARADRGDPRSEERGIRAGVQRMLAYAPGGFRPEHRLIRMLARTSRIATSPRHGRCRGFDPRFPPQLTPDQINALGPTHPGSVVARLHLTSSKKSSKMGDRRRVRVDVRWRATSQGLDKNPESAAVETAIPRCRIIMIIARERGRHRTLASREGRRMA
jgi:hypothetical protein